MHLSISTAEAALKPPADPHLRSGGGGAHSELVPMSTSSTSSPPASSSGGTRRVESPLPLLVPSPSSTGPPTRREGTDERLLIDTASLQHPNGAGSASAESPTSARPSLSERDWTWEGLRDRIHRAIARQLKYAGKGRKHLYIKQSTILIEEVRILLCASGTTRKDCTLLLHHPPLHGHHRAMMAALSTFVLECKAASAMWPSPDSNKKMVASAYALMESVSAFTQAGAEAGLPIMPVVEGEGASRGPSFAERSSNQLTNAELIMLLEMRASKVGATLQALGGKGAAETGMVGGGSPAESSEALLSPFMRDVSSFLALADTFPLLRSSEGVTTDLRATRSALLQGMTQLQLLPAYPSPPPVEQSGHEARLHSGWLAQAKVVADLVPRLLMSVKLAMEEKERAETLRLQAYIDQYGRARAASGASSASGGSSMGNSANGAGPGRGRSDSSPPATTLRSALPSAFPPVPEEAHLAPMSATSSSQPSSAFLHRHDYWFLEWSMPADLVMDAGDGSVKSGSLPSLLERLVMVEDATFTQHMLLTYRLYMSSAALVDTLLRYFNQHPPPELSTGEVEMWAERRLTPTRLRVIGLLKLWADQYALRHDPADAPALEMVSQFAKSPALGKAFPGEVAQLTRALTAPRPLGKKYGDAPAPVLPKNLRRFKFADVDTLELARQLSLMEFAFFSSIQYAELLNKAWSEKGRPDLAKNVRRVIGLSNRVTGWVQATILSESDIKKRAALIKHFIYLADRCRYLHNYNALMAILAGLSSSPIFRLARSWALLSQRTNATYAALRKLMDPAKNFANYREVLAGTNAFVPCIPFLGVTLTDLTFLEDGNPSSTKTGHIAFTKHARIADVIQELLRRQSVCYHLTPVEEVGHALNVWISDGTRLGEGELWNLSLTLEPKEREDEKLTRLLHESGLL